MTRAGDRGIMDNTRGVGGKSLPVSSTRLQLSGVGLPPAPRFQTELQEHAVKPEVAPRDIAPAKTAHVNGSPMSAEMP